MQKQLGGGPRRHLDYYFNEKIIHKELDAVSPMTSHLRAPYAYLCSSGRGARTRPHGPLRCSVSELRAALGLVDGRRD